MPRRFEWSAVLASIMLVGLSALLIACSESEDSLSPAFERARAGAAPAPREWRTYLGDAAVSHASPVDSIRRDNVQHMERAWVYDAGGLTDARYNEMQFNPLVVKGVLYAASPSLRMFALNAATGEELWSFDPEIPAELWTKNRGAIYWQDPKDPTDERVYFGAGPYLYALDARTGRPERGFDDDGRIDLRKGLGWDSDRDAMGVVTSTPGSVFEDLLLLGGRVGENRGAAPGHIRGFDARTGQQRWIFYTIPRPGTLGYETWPEEAWHTAGGANAWAGFSVDLERGLLFAPTGSATFDFYGGDRVGANLFANSLIALDARTGERRWHYQFVRHDIWDRDLPAPPNLVEIERNGRRIPAVAQVTKTGHTFLFHRETGEPLFPIIEEPVVGEAAPGEVVIASQPIPSKPPPFVRQGFRREFITDRTPAARAEIERKIANMRFGDLYIPPSRGGTIQYPGIDGGAEWGGAAWDAETGLLYVNANQTPSILQLLEAPDDINVFASPAGAYVMVCAGCHGLDMRGDGNRIPTLVNIDEKLGLAEIYRLVRDGRGHMPGFGGMVPWYGIAAVAWYVYSVDDEDRPSDWGERPGSKQILHAGYQDLIDSEQMPGSKPPWGTLTALDLAAGAIRWQIPFGDYPEILEAGLEGLGAQNYGGPVVTDGGLLFIAATPDKRLRAFDKYTGQLLWEGELPTGGFATPAVYEADGRPFVVIAAGGGKLRNPSGSKYIAFSLPTAMP